MVTPLVDISSGPDLGKRRVGGNPSHLKEMLSLSFHGSLMGKCLQESIVDKW